MPNFPWQYEEFAHDLGGTIVFVLAALVFQEPLLHPAGSRWRQALWLYGWCALAVGLPIVLAELGKHFLIWPGHKTFPSAHTALASATNVALIRLRGSGWAFLTLPCLGGMVWALIASHAHEPLDVLGGFVLGTGGALLLLLRATKSQKTSA